MFDKDGFVPDLKRVTDAVHVHGTPIFVELVAGFGTMVKSSPEWPHIVGSPKNVVIRRDWLMKGLNSPTDVVIPMPREVTVEEIRQIGQEMVMGAVRAQRAGFDGVEVAAMMRYSSRRFCRRGGTGEPTNTVAASRTGPGSW